MSISDGAMVPPEQGRGLYERLLSYTKPYSTRLIIGCIFCVVFAGSTVSLLPALYKVLPEIFNYELGGASSVWASASILMAIAVVRGIGQYLSSYLIQWVGNRVVMDLRIETFSHMQNLSVAYFDQNKTGEMISRAINDTTLLERAVSTVITDMFRQPVMFIGAVSALVWLDWRLTLASAVLLPMCILPITLFGKRVRRAGRQGQEHLADVVSIMQEAISGVRIVKAFGMEEREKNRFATSCSSFFSKCMRVTRSKAMIEPIIVMISVCAVVMALFYASKSKMPWQGFITYVLALVMLYDPVKRLSSIHLNIQHSLAAADRIFEILDTPSSVIDKPDAVVFDGQVGEIEFRDVGFAYGDKTVLTGIDLRVKAGERVAVVGGSGSGKTTLVNLLPRFFDVKSGAILFNGVDIRDLTMKSLRAGIGLVTQDTFLFNDTVANNIRYGTPGATLEAVIEAARLAHAQEFILQMPKGFDTVVGERGVMMSGGQRQRLAIARAILRNPQILILDEATSALDTESERMVQAALDEVVGGRTVFAIAHRLSTIAGYDRIIVLDGGVIAEQGRHAELMAGNGLYRRLHEMQAHRR